MPIDMIFHGWSMSLCQASQAERDDVFVGFEDRVRQPTIPNPSSGLSNQTASSPLSIAGKSVI